MSVLRAIAGMSNAPGNDRTTDEQVLIHLEQISCAKRLAILRLLFLIRLVRYAPAPLLRITILATPAEKSWLHSICVDIEYFCTVDPAVKSFFQGQV